MNYIKKCPKSPSFIQNGLTGYSYDIFDSNVSIDIEDVYEGHERYCKNIRGTFIYYVLSGTGVFKIGEECYSVEKEDVIEIPCNQEFVFKGTMKLLLITTPAFQVTDKIDGKENDL